MNKNTAGTRLYKAGVLACDTYRDKVIRRNSKGVSPVREGDALRKKLQGKRVLEVRT